MLKILQKENKILREKTAKVPSDELKSKKIKKIIAEMFITLNNARDGVALAAPQIGESLKIFVLSGKVFQAEEETEKVEENLVFINPEIIKSSKTRKWMEEGCLSVKGLTGRVSRATKCTIKAQDENGNYFTRGGSNLLAQIFQHEMDHLEGVLFIDKAKDLRELDKND